MREMVCRYRSGRRPPTREVVRVFKLESTDAPMLTVAGSNRYQFDHIFGQREWDPSWVWARPGDRPRWIAHVQAWPYIVMFSDGTIGVIRKGCWGAARRELGLV